MDYYADSNQRRVAKGPSPSAFPYLRLDLVELFVPRAIAVGAGDVTVSSLRGFLCAYRLASGDPTMLGREETTGLGWDYVRGRKLTAFMTQSRRHMERYWDRDGHPTRRHLTFIMWAFTPDAAGLTRYLEQWYVNR